MFNPDSIYLPTKKIGKNNPKAAEIEADNAARQEWNRTADMALISGIEEAKILEIKKDEIHQKQVNPLKRMDGCQICSAVLWARQRNFFAEPDKADGTTAQTGTQYGYGRVPHNAEADDTGAGQGKRNPQLAG